MAQSVKYPALDLGSGHDLTVVGSSSASGSVLSVEPAWDSLSSSPSALRPFVLSFSLSVSLSKYINKHLKK